MDLAAMAFVVGPFIGIPVAVACFVITTCLVRRFGVFAVSGAIATSLLLSCGSYWYYWGVSFEAANTNQDASSLVEQKLNLSLYGSAFLCIILAVYTVMVCTARHAGTRRADSASKADGANSVQSGARLEENR